MRGKTKFLLILSIVLTLLISIATPALARETKTNIEGAPELEATAIGSNEFLVGQTGALQIMVQNNGTFSGKIKRLNDKVMVVGYTSPMGGTLVSPCTTAMGITATLKTNVSSIEVLNDTAVIGTLPSGGSTMQPIAFQIRVDKNAKPGSYRFDLELRYTYLEDALWLNRISFPKYTDELQPSPYYEPQFEFYWSNNIQNEPIPIEVTGTYFSAEVSQMEGVRVGATGIIAVTIENSGLGEARDVTAEIVPGGNFIPVDGESFLGDINGGDSVTTEFKVSVSEEAIVKTCPLNIQIKYKDENDIPQQALITVGVPVEEELEFEIQRVGIESELTPGAEVVTSLPIKNASNSEVRDVLARINVVDPFTSTDETSYVGTLQAGETGIAKFKISADDDALPKPYALDVVVKYWDSEGDSYTSKPMKVELEVEPPPSSGLSTTLIIAIAGAAAGVSSYSIVRKRRKRLISTKG